MPKIINIGIAGATGYAGQELIKLAVRHQGVKLTTAMSSGAAEGNRHLPALSKTWDGEIAPLSIDQLAARTEAVFLALPDGVAAKVGSELITRGVRVFDLSGAFRLREEKLRARWYPDTPNLANTAVYGLTEYSRTELPAARLIACPGCYPTAAILALRPLFEAGLLEGDTIIDAKSGISGAGKKPSERTHFSECHGNVAAYGVFAHRHGAEIEQELGHAVTFTPHLVPLDRGILETIYVRTREGVNETDVAHAFHQAYLDAPFVRLTGDALPEIKNVTQTNFCDIGWKLDANSTRLLLVACLDNLVKGAAGQALQNLNIAFGLDETAGLS
ncbi:MAG: N-acetyl-gamma-glutamyl-phosphate reductase [Acidobacteria bacterium]|nr:N-acetyl-gamma-glutamyl-phosphate reductase [Acidobacteriota bacterium]|tara:strand:- start:7501 stop:8493 length:993 start_codon:yes stop_codon:yes gene_type:complete